MMVPRTLIAVFLCAFCRPAFALEVSCLGSTDAKRQIIYLHGLDSHAPGSHERQNRELLKILAEELDIRFALPRAADNCRGRRCWKYSNVDLENTYRDVLAAAKICFSGTEFGIIGFSNGGYFASQIATSCLAPQPQWIVAIASAGFAPTLKPPQTCAPLTLLVGDQDRVYDEAHRYGEALRRAGFEVVVQRFRGGHIIPADALKKKLIGINP